MNQRVMDFLLGITAMTVLWAGVSYTNPAYRCIGERGTVWVSAPASRCYPITEFMPAGALKEAR